jgi:hypothetical protein
MKANLQQSSRFAIYLNDENEPIWLVKSFKLYNNKIKIKFYEGEFQDFKSHEFTKSLKSSDFIRIDLLDEKNKIKRTLKLKFTMLNSVKETIKFCYEDIKPAVRIVELNCELMD